MEEEEEEETPFGGEVNDSEVKFGESSSVSSL